jgi:hypothetical protein
VGAALSATVILCLFISQPDTAARYSSPILLWLIALGLVYWLGRLWIKTARGEMHDDPIVFAAGDRGSRVTIALIIVVAIVAHYVRLG